MSDCNKCSNKTACWIYSQNRKAVHTEGYGCPGFADAEIPQIIHCYNCQYAEEGGGSYKCKVYHKWISFPRVRAILCKHYKKVGEHNE